MLPDLDSRDTVRREMPALVSEYLLWLEATRHRGGPLAIELLCELRVVSVACPYGDGPEQLGAGGDDEQSDGPGGAHAQ